MSEHNTRQPTAKDVAGLVESIRAGGQLTPGLARPHPAQPGCLELAAGARRRTACAILKIPFQVVVRDMTDEELKDAILTENLQRENPDPEAEADLIGLRLKEGATPSGIAARYGKTETWVKRRMKLLEVIPAIRKRFDKDLAHFTVEMRERLGALPDATQQDFSRHGHLLFHIRDMKGLEEQVRRVSHNLKGCATWLKDPDTFIPGCGPGCAASSAGDLFSDGKGNGCCMNPACFRKRRALAADKYFDTALAGRNLADFVLFRTQGWDDVFYRGKQLKLLDRWQFDEHYTVSKSPADLAGLDCTDPHKPRLVHLLRKAAAAKAGGSGRKDPGKQESREDKLTGKRLAEMNARVDDAIDKAPVPSGVDLLRLAAAFGMNVQESFCNSSTDHERAWTVLDAPEGGNIPSFDDFDEEGYPLPEVVWTHIRPILRSRLTFHTQRDLLKDFKRREMERLAGLIGLDYQAHWQDICHNTVPVPKSWGPGIDPMTLEKLPGKHTLHREPKKKAPARKAAAKKAKSSK